MKWVGFLKRLTRLANFYPNQPKQWKIKTEINKIRDENGNITSDTKKIHCGTW